MLIEPHLLTAMFTVNTPPSFVIVSRIRSIAFSRAFNPSAFSGVDVVITDNQANLNENSLKTNLLHRKINTTE